MDLGEGFIGVQENNGAARESRATSSATISS